MPIDWDESNPQSSLAIRVHSPKLEVDTGSGRYRFRKPASRNIAGPVARHRNEIGLVRPVLLRIHPFDVIVTHDGRCYLGHLHMSKIASRTLVVTSSPLFNLSDFEASNVSRRDDVHVSETYPST